MSSAALTEWLLERCRRHGFLRQFLDPLYLHAERRGHLHLVRENALRLLERAHVERLRGGEGARETASGAMDRFQSLAAQGDPDAAYHLAEAHRTGFGRPRNHWKALEHYQMAADLGHPGAPLRLKALQEGGEVEDDAFETFGRQALLKATYSAGVGEHRAAAWRQWLEEGLREGIGHRNALILLGLATILLGYLSLDIFFFGLGAWRPDPARVAWGVFGKIHPPKDASVGRVLPEWLRPDARSVAFRQKDYIHQTAGESRIADYAGKVVYLQVVDGRHPAVFESVAYLKALDERRDPSLQFFLVFMPNLERVSDVNSGIQWALEIAPVFPQSPRALRPLGEIRTFPMNFVIDRKGRIRQRWAGFSEAVTEEALKRALAES